METTKKVLAWVFLSSKNPQNWSLTLKGLIPMLAFLNIDVTLANDTVDAIVNLSQACAIAVTAGITAWGFLRKLSLTFFPEQS